MKIHKLITFVVIVDKFVAVVANDFVNNFTKTDSFIHIFVKLKERIKFRYLWNFLKLQIKIHKKFNSVHFVVRFAVVVANKFVSNLTKIDCFTHTFVKLEKGIKFRKPWNFLKLHIKIYKIFNFLDFVGTFAVGTCN